MGAESSQAMHIGFAAGLTGLGADGSDAAWPMSSLYARASGFWRRGTFVQFQLCESRQLPRGDVVPVDRVERRVHH